MTQQTNFVHIFNRDKVSYELEITYDIDPKSVLQVSIDAVTQLNGLEDLDPETFQVKLSQDEVAEIEQACRDHAHASQIHQKDIQS